MALQSTSDRYGTIAVSIHWLTAVLILIALGSGFSAADAVDTGNKAQLLRVHLSTAIAVFALTLFRVLWWWALDKKPDPAPGSPFWQERSARIVHFLFYIVTFGMVASGMGMVLLSGAGPVVFGQAGALPDFWTYAPRTPHGIGARLLLALLVFHTGAALYHHVFRQDGLVSRMWFAR